MRAIADREVVPVLFWGIPGRFVKALAGQETVNGATKLYAPQYAVGGAWRSTLSVVNLDNVSGEVSFEFTDRSGNSTTRVRPIAPRGKIFIAEQDFFVSPGRDLTEGHVRITGSGMNLAGCVAFGDSQRQVSATALPLVSQLQTDMVFSHLVSNGSYYTGVAVLNPNSMEASVTVEVRDNLGGLLTAYPVTVAAGRSASFVLSTLPGLNNLDLGAGYVRIRSSQPIAGYALFATHDNSAVSAIPSQPVVK